MVSQAAMRSQRVVESEWRCWNPAVWLLVFLLGSLILVAVSVLLRLGDVKISKRAVSTSGVQTSGNTPFEVQLVNGNNRCEGRVEVLSFGTWGTVCDDDWDMVDANVVCRQLDCGVAVNMGSSSKFGQGSGFIALDNVDCRGHETDLSQCSSLGWGVHNCYHYEDVGVTCKEPGPNIFGGPVTPPWNKYDLRDGAVRLVNGANQCEGRVEIFYQGNWGTVCDDDWTINNAMVVCRQLGCGMEAKAHIKSHFGYGIGLILLDNVNCHGDEPDLSRCRKLGWGQHNCGHHEDAGVTCTGLTSQAPVVTQNPRGHWRTFNTEATQTIPATDAPTTTTTVTTTAQTKGKPAIRLVSGNNSCQGRVEVNYKGVWGTVCDDDWSMYNAQVVCRQAGCGPAITFKIKAHFGYGSGPILLDNVECSGFEWDITQCFHLGWGQHNCGHHEDAGVICRLPDFNGRVQQDFSAIAQTVTVTATPTTTSQPSEGTVRLVDGMHQCEGRVEMYSNSTWGTVCDDAWDLPDAQVVCRQLGCGEASVARGESFFGPGTGTILLDNLKCTGAEASLQQCSHISWEVHNCDHTEDAGVTCSLS